MSRVCYGHSAVDSMLTRTTCDNHCARSVRPYTIHLSAKAYLALALVAVSCSFTARVAATIKAYRGTLRYHALHALGETWYQASRENWKKSEKKCKKKFIRQVVAI